MSSRFVTIVLMSVLIALMLQNAAFGVWFDVTGSSQSFGSVATFNLSEQCVIELPSSVTFVVTNLSTSTSAPAVSIDISNIALASATKQLKLSVRANSAEFTPPTPGATTWEAADVTWNAGVCSGAEGSSGTMSGSGFNTVATVTAGEASASTAGLVFTLDAKSSVKRSGNHTLTITWKVEAIGA